MFIQVTENCVSCGLNCIGVLEIPLLFMIFLCTTKSETGVQWVFKIMGVYVFSQQQYITCILWFPRSPYLKLCDYFYLGAEKIEFMQAIHSLCKNRKVMFQEELPYFKMSSPMCREVFLDGARPF